ncbi:MAG TPA: DsbA family protein [Acidimicrobiales bacterium]|nr:DsbA family protein [Acidimicrobiales bacterium]
MTTPAFTINFDYRCPFARNANEHVIAALEGGADYDVQFKAFSLTQVHTEEGQPAAWEDPSKRPDLIALAAGIVVRDRFPEQFPAAHVSLFAVRHDDGDDLRDEAKVRNALSRAGVDADAVFAELEAGWPFEVIRDEHTASVEQHQAFGVPTFIAEDEAVFVRLMTRPAGDGKLARDTVDRVLELVVGHPELNEYKHTSIPR